MVVPLNAEVILKELFQKKVEHDDALAARRVSLKLTQRASLWWV